MEISGVAYRGAIGRAMRNRLGTAIDNATIYEGTGARANTHKSPRAEAPERIRNTCYLKLLPGPVVVD